MRNIVYKLILDYEMHDTFINLSLKKINSDDIDNFNQITKRVYGYVQNTLYLDYLLSETLDSKKIDLETTIILKLAIYEHLFLDSIPFYAIKGEFMKLSKNVHSKSSKFVSYYLNQELEAIEHRLPTFANEAKNSSIKYSINQPIVKLLIKQYGDVAHDLFEDVNRKKTTFVRKLNEDIVLPESYQKFTFDDLFTYEGNITKDEHFLNNDVVIQDLGSYLVTFYLDPQAEDNILDLCAAPGNKTMHIAKYAKKVVANEINEVRAQLIKDNVTAKNLGNVEVINHDASCQMELDIDIEDAKFDKILVDAPCSGIGVIKSKPEIKTKLTLAHIKGLCDLQLEILLTSESYLSENGYLLYSTCSINKEENEQVISKFLNSSKYSYEVVENKTLEELTGQSTSESGYTLLPQIHNSDGFYMCLLKRT